MKTIALQKTQRETAVTVELTDSELTMLVALVEQGRQRLHRGDGLKSLHQRVDATAEEFCSLLGHLELLETND